jgi:RNA polymerase sigma factor (sigma-70 family)
MDDSLRDPVSIDVPDSGSGNKSRSVFATTQWSVVLEAGDHTSEKSAAALHQLCTVYWYPIYAFVRQRGSNFHEAEDSTQAFFEHLFEGEALTQVRQEKGRFRSFLVTALNNFLNNQWHKNRAWKRGGRRRIISLDEATAEELYRAEIVGDLAPVKLFDRRWAFLLIDTVFAQLREEYESTNNASLLVRLEPLITREVTPGVHENLAQEFGMSEGAVKVALHRLRRRFGDLLRREVSHTVADATALDDEVRYLLSAIAD